jgi:hypothetical protein
MDRDIPAWSRRQTVGQQGAWTSAWLCQALFPLSISVSPAEVQHQRVLRQCPRGRKELYSNPTSPGGPRKFNHHDKRPGSSWSRLEERGKKKQPFCTIFKSRLSQRCCKLHVCPPRRGWTLILVPVCAVSSGNRLFADEQVNHGPVHVTSGP